MSETQQGPKESTADRLKRTPSTLEAYARDIDKHGRPLDSGLPGILRFAAEQLRALLSHEPTRDDRERAREALHSKPGSCSCFAVGKEPRGCVGVCEDAVDRVSAKFSAGRAEERKNNDDTVAALAGLIGLIQLVSHRIQIEVRESIYANHRWETAQEALAAAQAIRDQKP